MEITITLNVVGIFVATVLVFFFGGNEIKDRVIHSWIAFCVSLSASITGWFIFIVIHFIIKFW